MKNYFLSATKQNISFLSHREKKLCILNVDCLQQQKRKYTHNKNIDVLKFPNQMSITEISLMISSSLFPINQVYT